MKTISVCCQKGGVGKTSTVMTLAAWLRKQGMKVLVVDLDSQCNASLTANVNSESASIYNVLYDGTPAAKAVQNSAIGWIIPGSVSNATRKPTTQELHALKNALAPLANAVDFCIIDCAPALDTLVAAALIASDFAIVPLIVSRYSMDAMQKTVSTVRTAQSVNPGLRLLGCTINRYSSRPAIDKEVLELLSAAAADAGTKIYRPFIRECVALRELEFNCDLWQSAPRSNAASDFNILYRNIFDDMERDNNE